MARLVTVTVNPSLDTTAVADRVEADRKIRCGEARLDAGGGGINVARAVTALGGDALAVWTMGGVFGTGIRGRLDAEGVGNVAVAIDGDTRQSFAVIEERTERHFRFSTPGPRLRPEELDGIVAAVEETAPEYLVISGGIPAGVDPGFYRRLAAVGFDAGARVVVDTHDEALRAVLEEGRVYLVKPNYRELLAAARVSPDGTEPDVVEAARRLIGATGTDVVVVSLGAGGAVLVTGDDADRIRAPTVPIRSRIGAGDSMVAGLVLRLQAGDSLPEAVRYGVAAGSAAVMTPGTKLCRLEDVDRLYASMEAP